MVFGPFLSNDRQRVGVLKKNERVEEMPLNIRIQWNAGTACMSECVLKTLVCRGLRVGPSLSWAKFSLFGRILPQTQWPPQPVECYAVSALPPRMLKDPLCDRGCDWEAAHPAPVLPFAMVPVQFS